jgi:hypothetical protein
MFTFSDRDDEVWYPGVVISDVPFGVIAGREWDRVLIGVQSPFKIRYLVGKAEATQSVLLLLFSDSGGEALGNVEDSSRVVLVELHHMFGRAGGDGSRRRHGGPYGG